MITAITGRPRKEFEYSIQFIEGTFSEKLGEVLAGVIVENIKVRQAFGLARLSHDGLTPEQFSATWPEADPSELLNDPEIARRVEIFAARADVQEAALNAQLRRALRGSVTTLSAKLESDDCTPGMAREIGDAMTKIGNLLDRRMEAKRDGGGEPEPVRSLRRLFGHFSVNTPEGGTTIQIGSRSLDDITIDVVRAMRCVTEDEVQAVLYEMTAKGWLCSLKLRGF